MNKNISEKILKFRKACSLTQEQLGEKLGITGQAVSKWEKGESMPDIMILPELCDIFGISVDALFEMPVSLKHKNITRDFCEHAMDNQPNKHLLNVFAGLHGGKEKLFENCRAINFAPDYLRIYESRGMGFILNTKELMDNTLNINLEETTYNLRKLNNENCLSVLRCVSIDKAVTINEIAEKIGLDEDSVYKILFAFMKRNFVICGIDDTGKRGYLQGNGMAGVYMILAGCNVLNNTGINQTSESITRAIK